ncbi:MAG TPA: leucyl aminopeptidase [Thermomicrobiaceae bacterium]|nr:leucyl aminopeptidase [Thermomicrobiaceae bacterium]
MDVSVRNLSLAREAFDAIIVPVGPDRALQPDGAAVDRAMGGILSTALGDADFEGGVGKAMVIPTLGHLPARRVVVVGIGAAAALSVAAVTRAWSVGIRAARDSGARTVASAAPPTGTDIAATDAYRAAATGAVLGAYEFLEYRTLDRPTRAVDSLTFAADSDEARRGVADGTAVAGGVSLARDLVNQPPDALYPERLAEIAQDVAGRTGLECRIHDRQALESMGAGATLGVGKGSAREPRLIHLTYTPQGPSLGSVGFVGKAITFDTGGINLKPTGGGLEHMKSDMAGGAAVIGAMSVLRALGVPFTVHGVVASAENMLSSTAFRPGDVLRAMNGKTIEVISTDAEGRLVLADALTYTARQGAHAMIDLATLTGASVVALGQQAAGVFGTSQPLVDDILAASGRTGELMWHMPLWPEYRELIRGDVADLKNSGGRPAGAVTAALFLKEFTEGVDWVHLDIAGPAWTERVTDLSTKGGTGYPVRTLLAFLENRASRRPNA